MRKWILLVALLLVFVAAVAVAVLNLEWYLNDNKAWLARQAEDMIGRPVHFEKIGVSLWGGLGVRVQKLRIPDDPAFSSEDFLLADDVRVRVRLLPALQGRYEIARVVLVAPSLTLIRNQEGLNLDAFIAGATPQSPVPGGASEREAAQPRATPTPETGPAAATAFLVSLIEVRDATVRYVDRSVDPPVELLVDQVHFTASDVSLDQPIGLDFEAAILGARTANLQLTGFVGPLDVEAPASSPLELKLALGPLELEALTRLGEVAKSMPPELSATRVLQATLELKGRLDQLAIEGFLDLQDSAIRYAESFDKPAGVPLRVAFAGLRDGDRVAIDALDLRVGQARLGVTGAVTTGDTATYDLRLVSESPIPLSGWDRLLPGMAGVDLGGAVTLDLRVTGSAAEPGLPALVGSVQLDEVEARVPGSPALSDLSTTITVEGHDAFLPSTTFRIGSSPVEAEVSVENLAAPTIVAALTSPALQLADLGLGAEGDGSLAGREGAAPPASQADPPDELRALALNTTLHLLDGRLEAVGTLRSSSGRVEGIDYENLTAEFQLHEGRATIENLELRAFSGEIQVTGFYDMSDPEGPSFDIQTSMKEVRIEELLQSQLPGAPRFLEGKGSGTISLRGVGSGWEEIKTALSGKGELRVEQGKLVDVNLADELLASLTGVPGLSALLPQKVRREHPGLFARADTLFDDLVGKLQVSDGVVRVSNLRLTARDYGIRAGGGVTLDGQVDLKATFIGSEALTSNLVGEVSQLKTLKGKSGRIEIPFRVAGQWPEVSARPDMKFVTQALQRALVGRLVDEVLGAPESGSDQTAEQEGGTPSAEEWIQRGIGELLGR